MKTLSFAIVVLSIVSAQIASANADCNKRSASDRHENTVAAKGTKTTSAQTAVVPSATGKGAK